MTREGSKAFDRVEKVTGRKLLDLAERYADEKLSNQDYTIEPAPFTKPMKM